MVDIRKQHVVGKNGLAFIVTLFAFLAATSFATPSVLAAHDTKIDISPGIANCQELNATYTLEVTNLQASSHSIREFRIFDDVDNNGQRDPGIVDFNCGPAPSGWTLTDRLALFNYCQYETSVVSSNRIFPGQTLNFTFSATLSNTTTQCGNSFRVASIDNATPIGQVVFKTPFVKVDCSVPEIEKMIGDPKIACDPNTTSCDYWVTKDTPIEVWASDSSDVCDLGLDSCKWRVVLDGQPGPWHTEKNGKSLHWNVSDDPLFDKDSNHFVEIECTDHARNIARLNETDKVDSTPPQTKKTLGMPLKKVGNVEWINSSTIITLHPTDPDPTGHSCNIGVNKTLWRNSIVDDSYCWNPTQNCRPCSLNGNCPQWSEYTGPFNKKEESCHLLEFYSVDTLGNTENIQTNCFFVDNTPPSPLLDWGTPNASIKGETYITQNTPITLGCDDRGDHPSKMETIFWRFSINQGPWTPWQSEMTNQTTFTFQEDSNHTLEFYCKDGVGNTAQPWTKVFIVDTVPPVIKKDIVGPSFGECPPRPLSNDTCFLKMGTSNISVTVTDPQPHPSDMVMCSYLIWWKGQLVAAEDWIGPNFTLNFTRDSRHDIGIYCTDLLGNIAVDNETFYVDGKTPQTTKTYDKPYFSCYDWCARDHPNNISACVKNMCGGVDQNNHTYPQWINSSTEVTLTSEDVKSGVNRVEKRTKVVDDRYCETVRFCSQFDITNNTGFSSPGSGRTFTLNEESCHVIKYRARDNVGNWEDWKWQCVFVDNKGPQVTKRIGEPSVFQNGVYYVNQKTPIHLACTDPLPHPVQHEMIHWRYNINGGNWTSWNWDNKNVTFSFGEDSRHMLEYYCSDGLGNEGERKTQVDIVDTVAPKTTKTYIGPLHLKKVCHGNQSCVTQEYIDTVTNISLHAEDPQPHPVGLLTTQYRTNLVPDSWCENPAQFCRPCTSNNNFNGCGEFKNYTGPFKIPEESCHLIEFFSKDKLQNTEKLNYQCAFVDKTPPKTDIHIYGQHFTCHSWCNLSNTQNMTACLMSMCGGMNSMGIWYPVWTNTKTKVNISAHDPEPHPSGVNTTFWRVSLLKDEACERVSVCQNSQGSGPWSSGTPTPFTINEESCHMIEAYSIDNVQKTERVHKECMFIDDSAPLPNKTVGEPKARWNGSDARFYNISHLCWNGKNTSIDCWRTTILTPIDLSCNDQQPHPVGHESVCFKVELDGKDEAKNVTQNYCKDYNGVYNKNGDGFCCTETEINQFYFGETSEHNLAYYCVDAVGNKGPLDDEKFKVEDTSFKIPINEKWNLISFPVHLLDDNIKAVFDEKNETVKSVWTYDAAVDDWFVYTPDGVDNDDLGTVLPGWGYWVLANDDDMITIGGSLLSPQKVPPSRKLYNGWNLIGHYGAEGLTTYTGPNLNGDGKRAKCALNSLGNTVFDKGFTALWTYWEPDNPDQWKGLSKLQFMNPGAGYWVRVNTNNAFEIYSPSTTCI